MNEVKKLTKSQQGFLASIRQRHNEAFNAEFNRAAGDVFEEMGLTEELKSGRVQLQLAKDYSVVTIVRPEKPPVPPVEPKAKIPTKIKK